MGDVLNRGTRANPRWYCRYVDIDGKRKQRKTKQPTKERAKDYLAKIEARIALGLIGVPEPTPEEAERATITVDELIKHFLGKVEGKLGHAPPRIKDLASYRRDAKSCFKVRVSPSIGTRAAASVTTRDVEAMRDKLIGEKRAAASVVQSLAILSKLYNWARKAGLIECANPVQGVERPRAAVSLDFLSHEETSRLLAVAEEEAIADGAEYEAILRWPMVAVAVFAGLRKGEIAGLRWGDTALDASRLDVLRSYTLAPKSGKPRHVPIHPEVGRALRWWKERCPATEEGLCFPVEVQPRPTRKPRPEPKPPTYRMGAPEDGHGLVDLLARAECHAPDHPWHGLRHTFASHFVMAGGNLFTLQRLLGHATPDMTMRYAHLAPSFLSGEITRLSFTVKATAQVVNINEARQQRTAASESTELGPLVVHGAGAK